MSCFIFLLYYHLADNDTVLRARDNIGHVVQPLIDGIQMFTKTSITLLIGSPPEVEGGNYFVKVLNTGKTLDGKEFHNWDKDGFRTNVLQHFVRFLSQTSGELFFVYCNNCRRSTISL